MSELLTAEGTHRVKIARLSAKNTAVRSTWKLDIEIFWSASLLIGEQYCVLFNIPRDGEQWALAEHYALARVKAMVVSVAHGFQAKHLDRLEEDERVAEVLEAMCWGRPHVVDVTVKTAHTRDGKPVTLYSWKSVKHHVSFGRMLVDASLEAGVAL